MLINKNTAVCLPVRDSTHFFYKQKQLVGDLYSLSYSSLVRYPFLLFKSTEKLSQHDEQVSSTVCITRVKINSRFCKTCLYLSYYVQTKNLYMIINSHDHNGGEENYNFACKTKKMIACKSKRNRLDVFEPVTRQSARRRPLQRYRSIRRALAWPTVWRLPPAAVQEVLKQHKKRISFELILENRLGQVIHLSL